MLFALRDGKARNSRPKAAQMLLQSRGAFMVGRHSNCSGSFKKSWASKTSCRRVVGPVWAKVDSTGLLRRQSSYDWTSGVIPLPFISTVRPQSPPVFDQPASTILWRPKCLSRSTHQPLKMLSDMGYARLTFRPRPRQGSRSGAEIRTCPGPWRRYFALLRKARNRCVASAASRQLFSNQTFAL